MFDTKHGSMNLASVAARGRRDVSRIVRRSAGTLALSVVAACARGSSPVPETARGPSGTDASGATVTATPEQAGRRAGEWESLFDGMTTAGWHNFRAPGKPLAGWQAIDGQLVRTAAVEDIVTDRTFADFELELEWQIGPGGNSGVLFRIDPTARVTYESGPELQVLDDDGHPDGESRLTAAGSVFGLYPISAGIVKPVGGWNAVRIVADGNHVEHWLNGTRIAAFDIGSADWSRRVDASKFKDWPKFGTATRGYIGLQEHGARVAYRNIRIRELP